jgi:hypothetical protein
MHEPPDARFERRINYGCRALDVHGAEVVAVPPAAEANRAGDVKNHLDTRNRGIHGFAVTDVAHDMLDKSRRVAKQIERGTLTAEDPDVVSAFE